MILSSMAKRIANQTPPRSFEEALAELERILGEIENGEVGLEESLVKYERGNFLIQHCRGVLTQAEQQIELLSKAADGQLKSEPLEPDGGIDDAAEANGAGMIDPPPRPPPQTM
jgi:exodeoxyribonuclease VII small subunit